MPKIIASLVVVTLLCLGLMQGQNTLTRPSANADSSSVDRGRNTVGESTVQGARPTNGLVSSISSSHAPEISYGNGQLTVVANNSTLSDVLVSIQRVIGARLEGTNVEFERVFGTFAGSPRQVLNSLLSGSRYDFILAGTVDDPGAVQEIVLTQRVVWSSNDRDTTAEIPPTQVVQPMLADVYSTGGAAKEPKDGKDEQIPSEANSPSERSQPHHRHKA